MPIKTKVVFIANTLCCPKYPYNSRNPLNNLVWWVLLLSPILQKTGAQRRSNLPLVTQLVAEQGYNLGSLAPESKL